MRADVYDMHDKAFSQVSAFVVLDKGERVATIAFKFPRDGAGRLSVFVHWIGAEMVHGTASGYGYDKRSAACSAAAKKLPAVFAAYDAQRREYGCKIDDEERREAFRAGLDKDDGHYWNHQLEKAGFRVIQAV